MTHVEEVGLARLRQALEANDWSDVRGDGTEFEGGSDVDVDFGEGFEDTEDRDLVTKQLLEDMNTTGQSKFSGEEEIKQEGDLGVQELQSMLLKMQAIKGMYTELQML